jgi:hypothetical protein
MRWHGTKRLEHYACFAHLKSHLRVVIVGVVVFPLSEVFDYELDTVAQPESFPEHVVSTFFAGDKNDLAT